MIPNTGAFSRSTIFITGGSRGIGKAIALKLAKDGANVAIAAKTVEKHPKLEGTIFTAAKEIEAAGGKCLPIQCDLRDEEAVKTAIDKTLQKFGALDVLVNNASAISLTGTEETTMKKYDLMHQINTRGTFMASKYALPHLKKSSRAHILNISPPLLMTPVWFGSHVAYTMAKYGMSMCVLGMAEEFKEHKIAVNALWPRTAIWTAATAMLGGGQGDQVQDTAKMCRKVEIMSDSAYSILSKDPTAATGNFFIDEYFLRKEGVTDFDQYAVEAGHDLAGDFFITEEQARGLVPDIESGSKADSQSPGLIGKVFEKAQTAITDGLKNELNATLVFSFNSGKNYVIEAHSSRPLKIEQVAELPEKSDVTLITDEETFIKMSQGHVNATSAFMSGKLKIKGNIGIAMKAEKLFKALKI